MPDRQLVDTPFVPATRTSRQAILDRVRAATAGFEPAPVRRDYRQAGAHPQPDPETLLEVLIDRLVDYKAEVTQCAITDVHTAVTAFLSAEEAVRVVVPDGFPDEWLAGSTDSESGLVRLDDTGPLTVDELDAADGVVTTCAVAVAETGTIVLDAGAGQGRRALTLLPDLHVVVVTADQVVARVPDALGRLDPRRPLTWISGPSATSDIELNRVEGVHGPRRLRVVVAESG
ncbi:MAG: LUD domain-containing protein [Acidimicrobiia bacterium]|nr:LUD domain-containing protein [Acidimicrobiia bacterium]MDH5520503.1 LUD domain-containing protein [Acidimicrobiia bacterium]